MLPYFSLFNFTHIHTGGMLMILSIVVSLVLFFLLIDKSEMSRKELLLMVTLSMVTSYLGARLFHVFFERWDFYSQNLNLIFTKFNGMTFYGSFLTGAAFLFLYIKLRKFSSELTGKIFDVATISVAFGYASMRLGCFASGCCWGKISTLPWAVQYYNPSSVMPYKGIPVHPVQLYDVLIGLLMVISFLKLRSLVPAVRGKLIYLFCIIYPVGRYVTEEFRGDSYRGVDLLFGMSTSQLISIIILIFGLYKVVTMFKYSGFLKLIPNVVLLMLLTSCVLPSAPNRFVVKSSTQIDEGITIHKMNSDYLSDDQELVNYNPTRNLILVMLDDSVGPNFQDKIDKMYGEEKDVQIEDLGWWHLSRKFRKLYKKIIHIGPSNFTTASLSDAIELIEKMDGEYDIFFMTHGIPNHLVTTKGNPLFSYDDIFNLKSKITKLQLVFMQSCYGSTIGQDWLNAGANDVIAFDGLNRNFFYVDFFLDNYYRSNYRAKRAYDKTNKTIRDKMSSKRLYLNLMKMMSNSIDEYFLISPPPSIFRKS